MTRRGADATELKLILMFDFIGMKGSVVTRSLCAQVIRLRVSHNQKRRNS